MRESIGGAWLFGIVIVFIFFFSAFLAYSISYTRAFNVKNEIINLIEHNEGYTAYDGEINGVKSVQERAKDIMTDMGYDISTASNIECDIGQNEDGFCLVKYCSDPDPSDPSKFLGESGTYYKVTTFIPLTLPIINIVIKIPISGETRSIYSDNGHYEPCYIP